VAKERVERDEEDLVRLYLTDIGQYPLLTKDDEVRLAQQIEAGNAARTELLTGGKRLTPAKKRELRKFGREGDNAQRTFVQSNLRLVVSIAKKYQASGLPLLDLIQEGNLGLMHAVEKFDWRKGFKFSTYATWWIRQAITRGIANTGRTIRLPVHAGDTLARLQKARSRLELKLGRPATLSELSAEVEMPEDKVTEALRFAAEPLSLSSRCVRTATPSSATSSRTARPSRPSRWPRPRCCPTRSRSCSPRSTSASADPRAALRARPRRAADARRGGRALQPHRGAHPPDRGARDVEAAPPVADTGARDLLAV
jgi:RNA polymerase sigma factor (sigma-70 family)